MRSFIMSFTSPCTTERKGFSLGNSGVSFYYIPCGFKFSVHMDHSDILLKTGLIYKTCFIQNKVRDGINDTILTFSDL